MVVSVIVLRTFDNFYDFFKRWAMDLKQRAYLRPGSHKPMVEIVPMDLQRMVSL